MNHVKSLSNNFSIHPLFNSSLFIASILFLVYLVLAWHNLPSWNVDNGYYIKVSQSQPVRRPFSVRVLYPKIASSIMDISKLSIRSSFVVANSLALLLFLLSITYLIKDITSYAYLALPILINPFILRSFQEAYLPDLFFAALVGLFFVLIYRSFFKLSLFVLLLIFVTRDDAILLFLSIILVGVYLSRWKMALSVLLVMIIGLIINSISARSGLPSPANINSFIFYLIRIPSNLFYNISGIPIWSNIYADICHPLIKLNLPTWLPFGNLHSIGICPPNITTPLRNLAFLLTTLGVLPSLLFYDLINNFTRIMRTTPSYILIALIYGTISFASAILLSMDIMRHAGQGWTACWFAMLALLPLHYKIDKPFVYRIALINLIVSWVPWMLLLHRVKPTFHYQFSREAFPTFLIIVVASTLLHLYAVKSIKNQEKFIPTGTGDTTLISQRS
jgi:hypothetical protein